MEYLYILVIIILILVGLMFIKKYFHLMNVESFMDFSPYQGNQSYPWVYQKHLDQKAFRKTLEHWEKPFNENDEGYWNAEPDGNPPLVPIYSYESMKHVKFNVQ
jgi:hypothetical protein